MSATGIHVIIREEEVAAVACRFYEERRRLELKDWYEAEEMLRRQISNDGPRRFSHETVNELAYRLWQARKGVIGSAEEDWRRALEFLKQLQAA
jgi:hypothetical protein